MFAPCSFNFWFYCFRNISTQGVNGSTIGQNKGSTEVKVETVTWPFCAPYAPGLIRQKGGHCLAGDYRREILSSKENRNTATKLSEKNVWNTSDLWNTS